MYRSQFVSKYLTMKAECIDLFYVVLVCVSIYLEMKMRRLEYGQELQRSFVVLNTILQILIFILGIVLCNSLVGSASTKHFSRKLEEHSPANVKAVDGYSYSNEIRRTSPIDLRLEQKHELQEAERAGGAVFGRAAR